MSAVAPRPLLANISEVFSQVTNNIVYEVTYEAERLVRPFRDRKGFALARYTLIFPFVAVISIISLVTTIVLNLLDLVLGIVQGVVGLRQMAYVFILPNMLIFGIFVLLPMFLNFYIGFTSGTSIRLENRDWVGTANVEELMNCGDFTDPQSCEEDLFWNGVNNTFFYVIVQVGTMVVLALATALALNGKIVLRGFFRSVFFYPVLLSPVVVALIWRWILDADAGLLNALLGNFGFEPTNFLTDPDWARLWVILVADWAQMGFYTLILLAGLQSIPASLYEAAEMDGASTVSRFRFVTMPLLMPTMTVVLVLALIRAVQVFDQVFVLTGGGPGTATFYLVQYIYRTAFIDGTRNFGLAAAASIMLAAVLLLLTLGQLYFARRRDAV